MHFSFCEVQCTKKRKRQPRPAAPYSKPAREQRVHRSTSFSSKETVAQPLRMQAKLEKGPTKRGGMQMSGMLDAHYCREWGQITPASSGLSWGTLPPPSADRISPSPDEISEKRGHSASPPLSPDMITQTDATLLATGGTFHGRYMAPPLCGKTVVLGADRPYAYGGSHFLMCRS